MKPLKIFLGSGMFSGYIPFAPGTFGSLFALVIYLIPGFDEYIIIIPAIIISFLVGLLLGNYFELLYGKDPKQFTLDEFVGTWIALLSLPHSFIEIIIIFIIWRFFDISKVYPANKLEALKGGLGIMMDDVVSGMYSLIIIYIFKVLFIS